MSYKPFSAISLVKDYYDRAAKGSRNAFLQLEALLKTLELPECDTVQVKNIVLNDATEISDDGSLTIYGGDVNYAMVCTDKPGASGSADAFDVLSAQLFCDVWMTIRCDSEILTEKVFYTRKEESDDVIMAIGYNPDDGFFCDLGATRYLSPLSVVRFAKERMVGQWFDVGVGIDIDNSLLHFYHDGQTSATQSVSIASCTADTITEIGDAGLSIAQFALVSSGMGSLLLPETAFLRAPLRRPAYAVNYYNFKPSILNALVIPDLTLEATYKTDLTLDIEKATLEQVEVI
jgi:hypothetical protein